MNKRFKNVFLIFIFCGIGAYSWMGCNSKTGPDTPYDLPFSPTPTPIVHIYGPVQVSVVDKNLAVQGVSVIAIPPSASSTFSAPTTTTGIATFNPPYLEVGNWTFIVPQQTGFPFAPSTVTMAVSVANEQANFNSASPSLQLTPPVPCAITGTSGGIFIYGVSYSQGNLLVPVRLGISTLPSNWTAAYGPATIGFVVDDSGSITVTGGGCVDKAASFSVTALDLEPTPYPRASSGPQTITKNFTSTVTVTWSQPIFNNYSTCNLVKQASGTLTVSSSNSCATVNVWINEPYTNCTSGYFNTPNGNTNAQGGVINFGPGSYSCSYYSDGGFPTFHATCTSNGVSGSSGVGNGSFTVLNTSY